MGIPAPHDLPWGLRVPLLQTAAHFPLYQQQMSLNTNTAYNLVSLPSKQELLKQA